MTSLGAATLLLAASVTNDIETATARPLSPGAMALLVEHAADPRALDRITAGLGSDDPRTRAAAARVVNVKGLAALAPRLAEVLAKEVDTAAAAEEARALLLLDLRSDDAVVGTASRLAAPASTGLALVLAEARGARAIGHLDALVTAGLPMKSLPAFLESAGRKDPGVLNIVATRAVRERNVDLWRACLDAMRRLETDVYPGLLVTPAPVIMTVTVNFEHR